MNTIRAVLAATDFSPDAVHACRRAAMVAQEHRAALDLLHVVEPDGSTALREWLAAHGDLRARMEEQARMLLEEQARQLTRVHGIPVQHQLRHGPVLRETVAAAAQAGLLVVGARGSHALRRLALGTTAERLMRTMDRPLLVVRQPPVAAYARVLVLTDFSASSDAALQAALVLAPQAAIHLVHSVDLAIEGRLRVAGVREEEIVSYREQSLAEASRRLQASLQGPDAQRIHVSVMGGDIRAEALRAIDDMGVDLVAVGKQGQSMLGDMLLGSTTSCMIANAPCDVLGVPAALAANPGAQPR